MAPTRACSHCLRPKRFGDEREVNEGGKHDVELAVAGEDPAEALQAPEEAFDFVAAVELLVEAPGAAAMLSGGHHRREPQIQGQLACFVAFVRTVHDEGDRFFGQWQRPQEPPSGGRVVVLSRREGEAHRSSSIRGNQMNFGAPSLS